MIERVIVVVVVVVVVVFVVKLAALLTFLDKSICLILKNKQTKKAT